MRAELVGAFGAAEGHVAVLPKALGIDQYTHLPNQPNEKGEEDKRPGEEAVYRNNGQKHHQMIPVEDPAGGAALVAHDEAEGTPDQYADKIADIENYGKNEKNISRHYAE